MTTNFIRITANDGDIPLTASTFIINDAQTIVRLIPEALVPAEALALQTLGISLSGSQSVGFVPNRAIGFPAWVILADPDNAHHALNLVGDIEWARRNAKNHGGRVKTHIDKIQSALEKSAPHFLPTFLEEVARIFAAVDNIVYAKPYFAKARRVERTYGIAVDPERHRQAFAEFAAAGVIGAQELSAEAADAATRMTPTQAHTYFQDLIITRAKNGVPVYTNVLRDIKKLSALAGKAPRQGEAEFISKYVLTKAFTKTANGILRKMLPYFAAAHELNPSVGATLIQQCPEEWKIEEYVDALQRTGLWDDLCSDSEAFAQWFLDLFANRCHAHFFNTSHPALISAIAQNARAFSGRELHRECDHVKRTNLDYFDVLLEAGVVVGSDNGDYYEIVNFDRWLDSGGQRDLQFVMAHKGFIGGLHHSTSVELLTKYLDKLLSFAPTTEFVTQWLERFAQSKLQALGCHKCLLDIHSQRELLTDPRLEKLNPAAMKEIFRFDAAADLAERIRRGTLAEYTWPALEQVLQEIPQQQRVSFFACYPYVAVSAGATVTVLDGDHIMNVSMPVGSRVNQVFVVAGQILVIYYDPKGTRYYLWSQEGVGYEMAKELNYKSDSYGNAQQIDGALQVGFDAIEPGMPITQRLYGFVQGTGPYYVSDGQHKPMITTWPKKRAVSEQDYGDGVQAGTLPGVDSSFLDFTSLPQDAHIVANDSFYLPVTETTKDSPFGSHNGCLVGFQFSVSKDQYFWFSPLGSFSTNNGRRFRALRRPGGGFWYLSNRNSLVDPVSGHHIAAALDENNNKIALHELPLVGYHQLKVRNPSVSAAMRKITVEQAQQFLNDPVHIADFTAGDEVLTGAIRGMVQQVSLTKPKTPEVLQSIKPHAPWHSTIKVASALRDVSDRLPEPPAMSEATYNYLYQSFDITRDSLASLRLLAAELSQPRVKGLADFAAYNSFVYLISLEKYIVAKLAAPMIPKNIFDELISLFTWLAEIGWLGTLQAVVLNSEGRNHTGRWYDNCLVLGSHWQNSVLLWNPHLTPNRPKVLKKLWQQDLSSLFLPKATFLSQLEALAHWRAHASEQQLDTRIHDLEKAAESLTQTTSLPPKAWQLLLSGAITRSNSNRSFSASDSKRLGTKPARLKVLHSYLSRLGPTQQPLLAATWHEKIATRGHKITNLTHAWEQELGTPWIHLSESDIEFLAHSIGFPLAAIASINSKKSVSLEPEIFVFYMALTQFVQPQSATAKELACRIKQFRNYQPPKDTVTLGSSYQTVFLQPLLHAPRALLEGHLDKLLHWLSHGTPVAGHQQNPTITAPAIVTEAATTLGISPDAACYFLQLLTVAHPTDAQIKTWNSWSTQQLAHARTELVDKQLVLQAQRAGTGRSVFLAGGWLQKSDTGPAMETWKAPHYLLWKDNKTRPVIPSCPPLLPYSELFVETWQRYIAGDTPGYEELRTARYRRKR